LPNHGIATAGIGPVDDINGQMGLMFGWFNEAHLSLPSSSICSGDETIMEIQ
jgi:hypothetical protein